jgi:hypothetical protein
VTAFNGGTYRHRPVADVIAELRLIQEKAILFVDDNLIGTRRDHLACSKELLQAMIAERLTRPLKRAPDGPSVALARSIAVSSSRRKCLRSVLSWMPFTPMQRAIASCGNPHAAMDLTVSRSSLATTSPNSNPLNRACVLLVSVIYLLKSQKATGA